MGNHQNHYFNTTHTSYSSYSNYSHYSQNLDPLNNAPSLPSTSTPQTIRIYDESVRSQHVVFDVYGPSMSAPVSNGLQNVPQQEIPPQPTYQEVYSLFKSVFKSHFLLIWYGFVLEYSVKIAVFYVLFTIVYVNAGVNFKKGLSVSKHQGWIKMVASPCTRSGMIVSSYVLLKLHSKPYALTNAIFSILMLVDDSHKMIRQVVNKSWEWGQKRISQLCIFWRPSSCFAKKEYDQDEQETNSEFDETGIPEEPNGTGEPAADEMV